MYITIQYLCWAPSSLLGGEVITMPIVEVESVNKVSLNILKRITHFLTGENIEVFAWQRRFHGNKNERWQGMYSMQQL